MKCKYTFKVEGEITPTLDYVIPLRGKIYDFVLEKDLISHISIIVSNYEEKYLPKVNIHNEGRIKASIDIPQDPYLWPIQEELRTFQGLMSLFGLESISIDNPKIEWIAENSEEKEKLKLIGINPKTYSKKNLPVHPLPHDLLVGALIAAKNNKEIEIPLNFYRKGVQDINERKYIEAIYDFYFVLETLYGDGKFKKNAILQKFNQSIDLKKAIEKALQNPDKGVLHDNRLRKIYETKISTKSVEELITYIVELRGFLHHHTIKRKDTWHPDKQNQFKVDALFLLDVCFNITMELFLNAALSDETRSIYESIKFRTKRNDKKTNNGINTDA